MSAPRVLLKFNSAVIKEYDLAKDVTTFGRKPDNDIVIDHPTISGFHGKIVKEGDHYFVEDLNSTNGTFVNGNRIKRAEIKNKDQIGAARHILEFLTELKAGPTPLMPSAKATSLEQFASSPSQSVENLREDLLHKGLAGTPETTGTTPKPASIAPKGAGAVPAGSPPAETAAGVVPGVVKVVAGAVDDQTEIALKDLVTYIGTADQAAIKIKGFLAPSLAAAISKRPEGYFLKAIKPGYPKVNGNAVKEQVYLENGAMIEAGGTNMVFYLTDARKKA